MFSYKLTCIDAGGDIMIDFNFNSKANGVPILSKNQIEYIAKMILADYNPRLLDKPMALDVEDFSEIYAGLAIDYKDLTHDRSILGMIVFNDGYVPVYDAKENRTEILSAKEGTILIDNSLLEDNQRGRCRFTHCHEVAHWVLHRRIYAATGGRFSCRTIDIESIGKKQLMTDEDWMEWQADYLASALLLPADIFTKTIKRYINMLGMEDWFNNMGINPERDIWAEEVALRMAKLFDVSLTAAKIRIKSLGLNKIKSGNKHYSII